MGNVKKKKIALGLQLLIALFFGGAAGYFLPQFASFYQFLGQAFIRLISMLIIPLVLPLVVVAVAEVLGKNHFQKLLGIKAQSSSILIRKIKSPRRILKGLRFLVFQCLLRSQRLISHPRIPLLS